MARRRGKNTRIRAVGGFVEFSFRDPQETEFFQALEHYGDGLKDWSAVFAEFAPYQLRSIDRNFQGQGRPKRWARLAPSTIAERIRLGYGRGPILQRTKRLRRGFRAEYGKTVLRIINRTPYFGYHQYGAPRANIPARQMIVLLAQDKAQFTRIARKHMRLING